MAIRRSVVALAVGCGWCVGVLAACSSDANTNGSASTAGNGGRVGNAAGGASSGAGAGASSMGIAGASTGGVGTAGASSGGASSAGASSGGASGGGAGAGAGAGTGGVSGGGAPSGSRNCAGNAVSLGANGTGTASDAARARIELDLGSDLPIGNAPRTVEFWAYIEPTDWVGEKNEIYVYGSPGTTNTAFGLDFGTNAVSGMVGNHATLNPCTNGSFTVDSTNDLGIASATSQWVHVAMTWDGSAFDTYVNGKLKITKTDATVMLATTKSVLTMGCNPPIDNCFNGYFDELRVWAVARSAGDIEASFGKSLSGNEAGLVGYWKFDEPPGAASAADSVTSAGHTAHTGQMLAQSTAQMPAFVAFDPPAPIVCP